LIAVGVAVEADEVVVDEKYWAAPAIRIELLELGNYQVRGLGARNPSLDLDDVAELALERAAARVLHGHGAVISRLNETEETRRLKAAENGTKNAI
jgi:hypothetical protein